MGGTSFLISAFLLLFSFLITTASADYGYGPERVDVNKLDSQKKESPLPIGVEGIVLCKSGSKYQPIQGAVTRVTCLAVDENGYETAPFSVLSYPSDAKGYFFTTLYPSQISNELKIRECKAFLEDSPLHNCKVPTDVNKGISGALLSGFRLLKNKNMKLYSVGPFFYTTI